MGLEGFHPAVRAWFETTLGVPTRPQELAWPAIRAGEDTLVAAPTGSGKTLAAFLAVLDDLVRRKLAGETAAGTSVLYVSPLKALSADIHVNLETPLAGIGAELERRGDSGVRIRTALRTGDTPPAARQSMARRPPDILVTTPESLYLLLTSPSGRRALASVRTVIVDEIHALAGNKRGSHLALSLERLQAIAAAPMTRIGLSATQRPIEEMVRFLVGAQPVDADGKPRCHVVDVGHARTIDLALELPSAPLEPVMSNELWGEVYERLCQLIAAHRTTLVFVNTRRLAERITHQLAQRLGERVVTSHHGSLSAKLRHEAERRLRAGELRALVATASLELGIDIGPVDLVCQIGSTRSIATLLQRVGRAGHRLAAVPKGRLFPLTRDELVESVALLGAVRAGALDALVIPRAPLDILAQQVVAETACRPWDEGELFDLVRRAYPYRGLTRERFDAVVSMLAGTLEGSRGRRGALVSRDPASGRLTGRSAARLAALMGAGAIPDTADYKVVLEPSGTVVGSVNEDFAVESSAGDIFLLGNSSWQIVKIESGLLRVVDAAGQPPTIPFWLGEAPGRTRELSQAVSEVRRRLDELLPDIHAAERFLRDEIGIDAVAAVQLVEYLAAAREVLGVLPTAHTLVAERFFDESGGMQLVLHSPQGSRVNRALGLALRKVFCRTFNFELQAAATEDAVVISLGERHSFPLDDVFRFLKARSVRQVLTQALLDAPMFQSRWRWNATRALVLPRTRGGRRIPPPILRMQAEDLIARVFPDQLACAENLVGERHIPDHPLVEQTVLDCLTEAMDIDALEELLGGVEHGVVRCIARDLPAPSPLALEILAARPYAFLDDAPLEERRARAVYTRRSLAPESARDLGALDLEAIARVRAEVWPAVASADELYDALVQLGVLGADELALYPNYEPWLHELAHAGRAWCMEKLGWVASERRLQLEAVLGAARGAPPAGLDPDVARKDLVACRLEVSGPTTGSALARRFGLPPASVEVALHSLESEGFVLRGSFSAGEREVEWCERRILARIHRLTIGRLRAEIEPVSLRELVRFLLIWQHVAPEARLQGDEGLAAVLAGLDGYEAPAATWERELLPARLEGYDPHWLDTLCLTGRVRWGRLRPPQGGEGAGRGTLASTPIALFSREHLPALSTLRVAPIAPLGVEARRLHEVFVRRGALFYDELARASGLLQAQVEDALAELVAFGLVTADSFMGVRSLLAVGRRERRDRRVRRGFGLEAAGRWSLLTGEAVDAEAARESAARLLLRRYGIVFRSLVAREPSAPPWRELLRVYRRLEARGAIRGGRFVAGPSGEQFALPDAIGLLRRVRREEASSELVVIAAADPVNLFGTVLPGERVPATGRNRIVLSAGEAEAALVGGRFVRLAPGPHAEAVLEAALVHDRRTGRLRSIVTGPPSAASG